MHETYSSFHGHCGKIFMVIAVIHAVELILFDLKESYSKLGGTLFRLEAKGMTQGSPAAPAGCIILLCYREWLWQKAWQNKIDSDSTLSILLCRWMDDIFVVCTVMFGLHKNEGRVIRKWKSQLARTKIANLMSALQNTYVSIGFKLKTELNSEFVGLVVNLDKSDATLAFEQKFQTGEPEVSRRFKHNCGNQDYNRKVATIQGQVCGNLDRTMFCDPVTSLTTVLKCFKTAGYHRAQAQTAVARVSLSHLYLKNTLATALEAAFPKLMCAVTHRKCW